MQFALHTTLELNNRHPILCNPNVRKAIASALPLDEMNKDLNNGYGILSNLPMPPNHPFIPANITDPMPYNIETAKEYMRKAGFDYNALSVGTASFPFEWLVIGIVVGAVIGAGILYL